MRATDATAATPDVLTPDFLDQQARSVLAFYHPACIDERGGYHQSFGPDGRPDRTCTQRHLVSSARLTINFAVAARHFRDPRLLPAVRHGLDFLRRRHRDPATGGHAWIIDRDRVVDGSLQAYGHAFVLIAHARALQAGVAEAGPGIAETFDFLERHFWEPDHALYAETRSADLHRLDAYRGQNANMHACEAMLAAFEATGEPRYLERATLVARRITVELARHTNGRIWEHYDTQWRQDFAYNRDDPNHKLRPWGFQPGHFTEWAKLLLQIHRHAPQPWLPERARALFDEAMAIGFDATHGGLYYSVAPDGRVCGSGKYSWVQAETIAAAAFLASTLDDGLYWCVYRQLWSYVLSHMVDERLGCWHRNLTRDNRPFTDGTAMGRTDYHAIGACTDISALLRGRPSPLR